MTIAKGSQVRKALTTDEEVDMGHLHHSFSGQRSEIIIADVSEKESPIQKTHLSESLLRRLRRPLGQMCETQTDVRKRTHQGRNGALGHCGE